MSRTRDLLRAVEDLHRVRKSLMRVVDANSHPACHHGALIALVVLDRHQAMRVGRLAELLRVDVSVASRQLAELEQQGYAKRTADPADGRAQLVEITPAGQDALAHVRTSVVRQTDAALEGWTDEEVVRLTTDLDRFVVAFESYSRALEGDRRPS